MSAEDYCDILEKKGVKITSNRLLVYQAMIGIGIEIEIGIGIGNTFSLIDLEDSLPTLDKSTIFRTILLFSKHDLIHSVDDGSASQKYCLCDNLGECSTEEMHCHFHCQKCKETYCLDNIPMPIIMLPIGFSVQSVNHVIKGICPACIRK